MLMRLVGSRFGVNWIWEKFVFMVLERVLMFVVLVSFGMFFRRMWLLVIRVIKSWLIIVFWLMRILLILLWIC